MFSKIAILACVFAVANAGIIGAPAVATYAAAPAYTSYAAPAYASYAEPTLTDNIYRSAGNLQTVSAHSRTIASPYLSGNKQFTRISNPAVYTQATTYPVAYSAAPAPVAHTYSAAPAPVAHHYAAAPAPVAHTWAAAPVQAHAAAPATNLLGVAYSPSVAVSHMTYNSPTIGYSW